MFENLRKEYFYSYILNKNEDGVLIGFEGVLGADIYDTALDVIKYLRIQRKSEEYILLFNEIELRVSRRSMVDSIVNEYYCKCNNITL